MASCLCAMTQRCVCGGSAQVVQPPSVPRQVHLMPIGSSSWLYLMDNDTLVWAPNAAVVSQPPCGTAVPCRSRPPHPPPCLPSCSRFDSAVQSATKPFRKRETHARFDGPKRSARLPARKWLWCVARTTGCPEALPLLTRVSPPNPNLALTPRNVIIGPGLDL